MDSNNPILDPNDAVDLRTTLSEGPPVPLSMLSDLRSRDDDHELVINTAQLGNVRLTTSGSGQSVVEDDLHETSVTLSPAVEPKTTNYPGLNLNSRYHI